MQTAQACLHVGPLIERSGLTTWQGLCLHLLFERAKGTKSSWYPYLALLPTELEMTELHPLMWPPVLANFWTCQRFSDWVLFLCILSFAFSTWSWMPGQLPAMVGRITHALKNGAEVFSMQVCSVPAMLIFLSLCLQCLSYMIWNMESASCFKGTFLFSETGFRILNVPYAQGF